MSLFTDVLERLSGIAIVKEQLSQTNRNIDRLIGWSLDHERRLTRLEAIGGGSAPPPVRRLKKE